MYSNTGDFRLESDERFRRGFRVMESGRRRRGRGRFLHALGRDRARRGTFAHRLAGLLSLGLGMPAPERRVVTDGWGYVAPITAPRAPVVACISPREFTYTFPYDGGKVHLHCRLGLWGDGEKYLILEDVTADTSQIANGVPDDVIAVYAEAAAASRGAVYGWSPRRTAACA